tara:strand:+ start:282 stop:980 length:699 start_codon:yes stop_codon:yes gene_type:complete
MTKLVPGSFLYNIVYGKNDNTIEKKPFYVQNKKDYLESLERNCKEMGIPFKKPYVEEIPLYEKVDDSIETHIEYLDQIVVNLNVLKSGKVRVKVLPQMAILNEKYYSKYKPPPIKSITSALKAIGYSQEFMDSMMVKYKKRNELIEKKWKILEKIFDTPSTASRNKKKKADKKAEAEAEAEAETEVVEYEDPEEEKKDDDEPEEDEAIVVDEEGDDEEEVVEDEYVSDGGDD